MLSVSTVKGAVRQNHMLRIAARHGFDARPVCDHGIAIYIPWTQRDGESGFEAFHCWTFAALRIALGY